MSECPNCTVQFLFLEFFFIEFSTQGDMKVDIITCWVKKHKKGVKKHKKTGMCVCVRVWVRVSARH